MPGAEGASGDTGGASGLGATPLDGGRRREERRDEAPAPAPSGQDAGYTGSRRRDDDDDIDVPPFMRH